MGVGIWLCYGSQSLTVKSALPSQRSLPCRAANPTTSLMEILVISLPNDTARRTRLEASLAPFGLTYHWLEAVDARGWQGAELAQHMNKASTFFTMSYTPNPGAVGCHLSHIKAFSYLLESDKEAVIILEDDAEITADFVANLPYLEQAMSALDIIFLCDRRANRPSRLIGKAPTGLEFRFKKFANIGTNGYVINRKAAAYMLAHHAKFGLEIDMCLNKWWQSGLHIATTSPDLVTHNDMGSVIGYEGLKPAPHIGQRIAASCYRSVYSLVKRVLFAAHHRKMVRAFEKKSEIA